MARITSAGMESITRPHETGLTDYRGPITPITIHRGPHLQKRLCVEDALATLKPPAPPHRRARGVCTGSDFQKRKIKSERKNTFFSFPLFSANKSSPLLPERSCEQLSHCTTSTITNCFAVHISANSIKQPNDCKDDGQLQQQDDGHLQQQTPW